MSFEISYFVFMFSFKNINAISAYKKIQIIHNCIQILFFLHKYSSWLHELLDLSSTRKLIKLYLHVC